LRCRGAYRLCLSLANRFSFSSEVATPTVGRYAPRNRHRLADRVGIGKAISFGKTPSGTEARRGRCEKAA
jgi:hypothetical protein